MNTATKPNQGEKIYDTDRLEILAQRAGTHFFDTDTLRYFNSRIHETVYGNRYFITSEQYTTYYPTYQSDPRMYTVREFRFYINEDGRTRVNINTVGEFQQFETRDQAHGAARRLAAFMGDSSQELAYPTPEAGLIAAGIK